MNSFEVVAIFITQHMNMGGQNACGLQEWRRQEVARGREQYAKRRHRAPLHHKQSLQREG